MIISILALIMAVLYGPSNTFLKAGVVGDYGTVVKLDSIIVGPGAFPNYAYRGDVYNNITQNVESNVMIDIPSGFGGLHDIEVGQIVNFPSVHIDRAGATHNPNDSFWVVAPDLFNEEFLRGYTAGYDNGESDGYNNGFDDGYDNGYGIGDLDGYNRGLLHGYDAGYADGLNDGLDNDYLDGYDNGFDDGISLGLFNGWYHFLDQEASWYLQNGVENTNAVNTLGANEMVWNAEADRFYMELKSWKIRLYTYHYNIDAIHDSYRIVFPHIDDYYLEKYNQGNVYYSSTYPTNHLSFGANIFYPSASDGTYEHYYIDSGFDHIVLFVFKDKIDSMYGDNILEKVHNYFRLNEVYFIFEIENGPILPIRLQDMYGIPIMEQMYQNGYKTGLAENMDSNWLKGIFGSISAFLSIAIFPGITIGLLLATPLIFGLLVVIIKIFKG